jgi:hypothetical protein
MKLGRRNPYQEAGDRKGMIHFKSIKILLASAVLLVWIFYWTTRNIQVIVLSSFLTGIFFFVFGIEEYQRGRKRNGHWLIGGSFFIIFISTIHFMLTILEN